MYRTERRGDPPDTPLQGHNLLHAISILMVNLRQRYHAISISWMHLGNYSVKLPDGLVLQQLV